MGIDLLTADAAFPLRRGPDWSAARRAIGQVAVEHIDPDWFDVGSGEPTEVEAEQVRAQLADDLGVFASVLSDGPRGDLDVIYTSGHCYVVTGGANAGEDPTSLCDPLWNLATVGVLQAAGSAVCTNMGNQDFPLPAGGRDRPWTPPAANRCEGLLSWFVAEAAPDWEAALRVSGSALEEDLRLLREEMAAFLQGGMTGLVSTTRVGESTVWLFGRLGGSDDLAGSVDRLRDAGALAAAGLK